MDERLFRDYLHSLWPEFEIVGLSVVETGWASRVAMVNGEWIFRVPRGANARKALAVEAALLPQLAPLLPAPIPAFEYLSLAPPCAGYRMIVGVPLDLHNPSRSIAQQLGLFLRALHSFSVDRARALGVTGGDVSEWRSQIVRECSEIAGRVLPLMDAADATRAETYLQEFLDSDRNFDFGVALIHADLGPDHVLCSGDRIAGIFDWGDVRIGDPALDLAWPCNGFSPETVSLLLESYDRGVDDSLLRRALFWHRFGPWHEVIYGLDVAEECVASGLEGVRSRLP